MLLQVWNSNIWPTMLSDVSKIFFKIWCHLFNTSFNIMPFLEKSGKVSPKHFLSRDCSYLFMITVKVLLAVILSVILGTSKLAFTLWLCAFVHKHVYSLPTWLSKTWQLCQDVQFNHVIILQRYGGTTLNDSNEPPPPGAPSQDKQEWEVCSKSEHRRRQNM